MPNEDWREIISSSRNYKVVGQPCPPYSERAKRRSQPPSRKVFVGVLKPVASARPVSRSAASRRLSGSREEHLLDKLAALLRALPGRSRARVW